MPTLTVIAGLPGSGKTTLLDEITADLPGISVSDYMKDSKNNSSALRDSKHHDSLISALKEGKDCAIADVVFVIREKREEFVSALQSEVSGVSINWICFENDWLQCLQNVDRRAGTDSAKFERDATTVISLVRKHSAPTDAEMRPVWKPPAAQ